MQLGAVWRLFAAGDPRSQRRLVTAVTGWPSPSPTRQRGQDVCDLNTGRGTVHHAHSVVNRGVERAGTSQRRTAPRDRGG